MTKAQSQERIALNFLFERNCIVRPKVSCYFHIHILRERSAKLYCFYANFILQTLTIACQTHVTTEEAALPQLMATNATVWMVSQVRIVNHVSSNSLCSNL